MTPRQFLESVTATRRVPVRPGYAPSIVCMSPVSRGRRRRKDKHAKGNASRRPSTERRGFGGPSAGERPSTWTVLESLAGPRERPAWFDSSIKGVLDRADVVLAARRPRELEDLTAGLLGAELHRIIHEAHRGLWFDWWFEQLVEAAVARIRVEAGTDGAWQAPWWLLHGLTSIGPPGLSAAAQTALGRARKELRRDALQVAARLVATASADQRHR